MNAHGPQGYETPSLAALGASRSFAEDFDILSCRIIIHSEGMCFIDRIRFHLSTISGR
jgi:hypothetical protein